MTAESFSTREEDLLVKRAQQGSAQAFAILVERYQRFAYNLALRTFGSPEEAYDVVQEAFLRAWKALPSFKQQAQFRTWLYRIVVNLCYNRLPGLRADLAVDALEDDVFPVDRSSDPGDDIERQERISSLSVQVAALPPASQMLLQLRYQEDMPYADIAQILNLPLGTVKNRLFRIHQQLYTAIQAEEEVVKCL